MNRPTIDLTTIATTDATFDGVPVVSVRLVLADGREQRLELLPVADGCDKVLTSRRRRILDTLVAAALPMTPKAIAARMGLKSHAGTFHADLQRLAKAGTVVQHDGYFSLPTTTEPVSTPPERNFQ